MNAPRLRSLWNIMQDLNARDFALHFQGVTSFHQMLVDTRQSGNLWCSPISAFEILRTHVEGLHGICVDLELGGAAASLERIQELFAFLAPVPEDPRLLHMPIDRFPAFLAAFGEV